MIKVVTQIGMAYVNPADIPERRIVWLEENDIIVVRSGAYTGDSAIIKKENLPAIAGFDMVFKTIIGFPPFVQYALLSNYLKNSQLDLERLRAAQPHLNAEELGFATVVLPVNLSEQKEIASYLERTAATIDLMIIESEKGILLLNERRSALISAAVTGKIDIRSWAQHNACSTSTPAEACADVG